MHVARRVIHREGPDVTMAAIAAASGTSKSVVYRYFEDKDELKDAIGEAILGHMHDQIAAIAGSAPDFETQVSAIVTRYVEEAASSINVYRFVIQPSAGLSNFLTHTADLIASIVPDTVEREHATAWARGAVGFVRDAFQWWVDSDTDMPTQELADRITTSLVQGAPS